MAATTRLREDVTVELTQGSEQALGLAVARIRARKRSANLRAAPNSGAARPAALPIAGGF
jgi:hypothetical protein